MARKPRPEPPPTGPREDRPLKVFLSNRGNVDFDQDPDRPVYGRPPDRWQEVADLAEASAACRYYIRNNGLGMGHWAGGLVRETATGKAVAYISFNGRIWGRDDIKGDPMWTKFNHYREICGGGETDGG